MARRPPVLSTSITRRVKPWACSLAAHAGVLGLFWGLAQRQPDAVTAVATAGDAGCVPQAWVTPQSFARPVMAPDDPVDPVIAAEPLDLADLELPPELEPEPERGPDLLPTAPPDAPATEPTVSRRESSLPPPSTSSLPGEAPAPLVRVQPVYPLRARRRGEEGDVVLRLEIARDGQPAQVEVLRSSGSSDLDGAALDAVRRWRFPPPGDGPRRTQLTIRFALRS